VQWELTRGAWNTRILAFFEREAGLKKWIQIEFKEVFRIRGSLGSVCFGGFGFGFFHEQAKNEENT
jgi:hypothetical protein